MPGIKHIEFWVSNLARALSFYAELFAIIGWQKLDANSFSDGTTKIYFVEQSVAFAKNIGPRHICFLADTEKAVDDVSLFCRERGARMLRGPVVSKYMDRESYTVDFTDPDGYIIEVATASKSSVG